VSGNPCQAVAPNRDAMLNLGTDDSKSLLQRIVQTSIAQTSAIG
jgi:hypothetical protein